MTENKSEKMSSNYSLEVIRYTIPPDQKGSFENAYRQAAEYLKQSEHCLGFDIFEGVEEPENFIIHIRWTSIDDHLNGFRKSAVFPPFFNLVKPFYNNIREMKHYSLTDNTWSGS